MTLNLDEIEARANAATSGPWKLEDHHMVRCNYPSKRDPNWRDWICQASAFPIAGHDQINAEFIAHARTDIPNLTQAVRELAEALNECISALDNDFGESIVGQALPKSKSVLEKWGLK